MLYLLDKRGNEAQRHKPRGGSAISVPFPFIIDEPTNDHAWSEVLALGRAHHLSAYDASYLDLALRRGLPLASLDGQLKTAASALGVPMFVP